MESRPINIAIVMFSFKVTLVGGPVLPETACPTIAIGVHIKWDTRI